MERQCVDITSLDLDIHPAAARFEESAADAFHSPLPADVCRSTFVALHPPTFATLNRREWLVANHLSFLLIVRVLKLTEFDAYRCNKLECRNARDVARFARCDRLLYRGILNRPEKINRASRTYAAQARRIQAGQVCPICSTDSVPTPLAAPKHAPGLTRRGNGGPIICKSCGFRIDLSVEQLQAFIHHKLPTPELVQVHRDPQGNRTACPACAKAGRPGILLIRKPTATNGAMHVACSRSIHFHASPECDHSVAAPVQGAA